MNPFERLIVDNTFPEIHSKKLFCLGGHAGELHLNGIYTYTYLMGKRK